MYKDPTNGRFFKGHTTPPEIQEKINVEIKKQWRQRENYHGMHGTKFYNCFRSMITRCNGSAGKDSIKKYRDKGITVCDKWKKFKGFYEDMFPTYVEGYQIDRICNSLGYFKENCRWATPKEQANNKTNNIIISHNGITKTLSQWADYLNLPYTTLQNRYHRFYKKGRYKENKLLSPRSATI